MAAVGGCGAAGFCRCPGVAAQQSAYPGGWCAAAAVWHPFTGAKPTVLVAEKLGAAGENDFQCAHPLRQAGPASAVVPPLPQVWRCSRRWPMWTAPTT